MTMPSYLQAAENHTLLNATEESWTDKILNLPKTFALGVGAGVVETINVPITVGNWIGADMERVQYKDVLQSFDDDLSKYYTDHKLGIDTIGFITGSMVVGMAGIKALNAGQTMLRTAIGEGVFGDNIGTALGLLAPNRTKALAEAMTAIRGTGSVFSLVETNTLRALAAGTGQAVLESAAFETLVAATMYNSPVLSEMSVTDLGWNIAIGTGVGGAIGGIFSGIGTAYKVSKAGTAAQKELLPFSITAVPDPKTGPSNALLFRLNQIDSIENTPLPTTGDLVERATRTKEATINKLWNDVRGDLSALAKDDQGVASALFQTVRLNKLDANLNNFLDSVVAGRVNVTNDVERELNKISRILKKQGTLTDEQMKFFADRQVSYVKLIGEDAGKVLHDRPAVLSVTDNLKDSEKIELVRDGVRIGKKTFTHDNNPHMEFNMFGADHYRVESRYWWAEKLPKWVDDKVDPITVHATDVPLLEKAYRDGLERLAIIPEKGSLKDVVKLNSKQEIYDFMLIQKTSVYDRLMKAEPSKISIPEFVDKFKGLFGINFNITEEAGADYYGFFQRLAGKGGWKKNLDMVGDYIALDKIQSLTLPLARMMRTLKHEEGHRIFQALLDAKGVTVANLEVRMPLLFTELRTIGDRLRPEYYKWAFQNMSKGDVIHEYFADAFYYFSRNPEKLKTYDTLNQAIGHLVKPIPQEVIDAVAKRAARVTPEEAAKIVNVETKFLDGAGRRPGGEFAREMARKEYRDQMVAAGVRESERLADPLILPSYAKIITKTSHLKDVSGNEIQGIAKVMQQAKLYDEASRRRATQILGEELPLLPDKEFLIAANSGPGLATSAEASYGTWNSVLAYTGQRTHNLIKKSKEFTSELFTPTLNKIANNTDEVIEWSVLNEKLRNLPQKYFLSADGTSLTYGKMPLQEAFDDPKNYAKALDAFNNLQLDAQSHGFPLEIPIKGSTTQQLVRDHISRNGTRVTNRGLIRAGEGLPDNLDPESFYPIPRSPKDTPYYALVIDDSITGQGHTKMIYAADEKKLELMKNEISEKMPSVRVLTKSQSEDYFKAHGEFEFERSMNENWINTEMARRGVSASYLPLTDPSRVVQHFLEWHLNRDAAMVREAVSHNYSRQFEALRQAAGESLSAATSVFGYTGKLAELESALDNPATNMIKMALDIQKTAEYPIWTSMNRYADKVFSEVFTRAGAVITDATSPEHLEKINSALKKAGYEGITNITPGLYQAMNGTVPRGVLSSFVNKANGLLATFVLRLDPLNAMNNMIGQNVLLGTEVKAISRAINESSPEAAGELAQLMKVKAPGTDYAIESPAKLIANSITRYHTDKASRQFYKTHGFITTITDQYDQTLDTLAIAGGDNLALLNQRIAKALTIARKVGDTGERLTANRFAEEFNRFVAADVMKQITDVAVKHGVITDLDALTYINTFVNRTQGNFLASQRPLMFQGPIGQAMGLFQTYQFNLIQQLTRHVGEGNIKNAMTMMGLQGLIYGVNGLPGFAAMNTYLVGSAPGNKDHTDIYRAAYNAAGKEAGDWLMYGLGSNWMSIFTPDLKTNLYSRGDINPRQISVVPVNPFNYPIAQATTRLIANTAEAFKKLDNGADVFSTFLRAVEQNGISRPLAGMAQVLGGMTSDSGKVTPMNQKGNILMAHDWLNLASAVRVIGGKPLDEALVNDAMYRFNSYRSWDAMKKATLGESIKLSILGGSVPDEAQVRSFTESYVQAGGDQKEFAQFWARQYKNATVSQANQLREKLSMPYHQTLQEIQGGYRLEDLSR